MARQLTMRVTDPRRSLVGDYGMTLPGVYWRIARQYTAGYGSVVLTLDPVLGHELDLRGVRADELHLLVSITDEARRR